MEYIEPFYFYIEIFFSNKAESLGNYIHYHCIYNRRNPLASKDKIAVPALWFPIAISIRVKNI
jgi:hypothetical protein